MRKDIFSQQFLPHNISLHSTMVIYQKGNIQVIHHLQEERAKNEIEVEILSGLTPLGTAMSMGV